jgi:hypothetical protein
MSTLEDLVACFPAIIIATIAQAPIMFRASRVLPLASAMETAAWPSSGIYSYFISSTSSVVLKPRGRGPGAAILIITWHERAEGDRHFYQQHNLDHVHKNSKVY